MSQFDKIAFDIELMRPGCVLIQATMGCDSHVASEFPTDSWLLVPTPAMRVYPLRGNQLQQLIKMVADRAKLNSTEVA